MTNIELEKRITFLETEVALLKSKVQKKKRRSRGGKKSRELLLTIRPTMRQCDLGGNIVCLRERITTKTKNNDNSRHRLPQHI